MTTSSPNPTAPPGTLPVTAPAVPPGGTPVAAPAAVPPGGEPVTAPRTPTIDALRAKPIPVTCKGFGPLAALRSITAATIAAERPALLGGAFSFPLMTLRESALRHNITAMAAYCDSSGLQFAPHGKTPMSPQLATAQLAAGAWGITVATIGQLQTYRSFGVSRLLLANELVDPAGIAWLAGELAADPAFEAYCYVDSVDGVQILDEVLGAHPAGRALPVLIEAGFPNGRTGVRTVPEAMAIARAVAGTETLALAGVSGYEGGLGHQADAATLDAVATFTRSLRELTVALHDAGLLGADALISAGGSAFFDAVVPELTDGWPDAWRPTALLRSGSYLTHDHGHYHDVSPAERHAAGALTLIPALELWAPVLSRPEPGLALLGAGRRDVSFDEGLPIPLHTHHRNGIRSDAAGWRVTALNDQHAYLQLPETAELGPGDLLCLGISHPCTSFDKWQVLPVLDDENQVIDAVHTFF